MVLRYPFPDQVAKHLLIIPIQLCGYGLLNRGRLYPILEGVGSPPFPLIGG